MNFATVQLTGAQQAFIDDVRAVLEAHWSPDPTAIAMDHERMPEGLRRAIADRGWLRPTAPVAEGGGGLDPLEARLLELLLDAYLVPTGGDTLIVSVVPAIQAFGSDELTRTVLPQLASGHATVCLGYSEPDCGSDMGAVRTRAVQRPDGDWVIDGAKMWTSFGHESDYVFLLTRTGAPEDRKRGLTMFLVPMDSPGVEWRPVQGMARVRTNIVFFSNVVVPDTHRLGEVGGGWEVLSAPLAAEHGRDGQADPYADINGVMGTMFSRTLERLVEHTAVWAMTPAGPDGSRPIDDEHLELALADALLDVELCRGAPGEMGKPLSAEALLRHADALADLTAPFGVLDHGAVGAAAAGVVSEARLHAPATKIYGGTSEIYRNNIAAGELGLPRPY
ncbi:acyl-CoA dehydrogenase family protein [Euzebya sp.]|uniref:acyl-CoA dehydrogenase family protein n=1 Tax=Euzebya sp. TaxID=1971409 RepID=UPI0035156CF7